MLKEIFEFKKLYNNKKDRLKYLYNKNSQLDYFCQEIKKTF